MRKPLALVLVMAVVLCVSAASFAASTANATAASVSIVLEGRLPMKAKTSSVGASIGVGLAASARSTYSRYDLNQDERVNIVDLSLLANHYGQRDSAYDLNGDSLVDLYDLVGLARQMSLAEVKLSASAFSASLSTGTVPGSITAGAHGTLDFRGQPDEAVLVSLTFEAPAGSVLDLLSLTSSELGQMPVAKHLDTLTVTVEQLLGSSNFGPVTLKMMRDFLGSTITLAGKVSHPDYLPADATLLVILK